MIFYDRSSTFLFLYTVEHVRADHVYRLITSTQQVLQTLTIMELFYTLCVMFLQISLCKSQCMQRFVSINAISFFLTICSTIVLK